MSPIDPFGPTPDPAGYVPRPATERALEALQAALADGAVAVALRGPSGIGKTLLLHVLAARNASARRVAYVRYPQMAAEDQCRWVLATLGEATDGDPSEALLAAARSGAGLVLLCDEADHFPEAAAEALLDLARGSGGAIQLVLVAGEAAAEAEEDAENAETDEEWPAPWRGGAAAGPVVWLREPMNGDETAAYVAARLERAGADEATRARFHPAVLRAMAERSGGLPSALHAEAERELGSPGTRSASVEDVAAGAAAARARREAQAADRERWRAAVSTALERSGRAERPRRVRPKGAGRRG
ncbi:MAG: ATP-binding protein, partial [Myxococcota bacterium]|nr:ATP-binding protein [Myxococcota bacterium]